MSGDSLQHIKRLANGEPPKFRRKGKSRAERKRLQRERRLPKDRVCPVCHKIVVETRSWVVGEKAHGLIAICRKCCWTKSLWATVYRWNDQVEKTVGHRLADLRKEGVSYTLQTTDDYIYIVAHSKDEVKVCYPLRS